MVTASLSLQAGARGAARASTGQDHAAGGSQRILPVWQADSRAVFGLRPPNDGLASEKAGRERGARRHTVQPAKWCSIESNSNAKTLSEVAIYAISCPKIHQEGADKPT